MLIGFRLFFKWKVKIKKVLSNIVTQKSLHLKSYKLVI